MNKKFLVYIVVLPLFAFPGFAFAMNDTSVVSSTSNYSEEELVTLIKKLQNQLEEVRKNKVQCLLSEVDLSIGDGEGDNLKEQVKSLQNFLREKGYLKANATGYFGKLTRTALTNFQRDNSIELTGELNASTRSSIKGLKCRKDFIINKTETKTQVKDTTSNVSAVTSIALEATGNALKWTTVGSPKYGYKIVWSKNPNPTYPTRDGDKYIYLSEPSASGTTLEAFNGTGTYYAKVCEYLGGSCGLFSNEIVVSL